MKTNVMVDIETLGVKRDAVVLQIGAVVFDENFEIKEKLCHNLSVDAQIACERSVETGALSWWFEQPQELQVSVILPSFDRDKISASVDSYRYFLGFDSKATFWSQGSFDFDILEDLYSPLGGAPWKYYQLRDLRSVMKFADMCGVDSKAIRDKAREGRNAHNALDDCLIQIEVLKGITRCLKKTAS